MNLRRGLVTLLLAGALACTPAPKENRDAPTTPTSAVASANGVDAAPAASTEAPDATPRAAGVRVVTASQDTDALSLVRTERLKAKAEGRVLVVYAGASWCEPCKRFKEQVHTGRLDEKLPHVTLLAFDADRDTDRLAAAGYTFSFIPFVALPGADGHPSDTQEARGKGSNAWTELVGKLEAWDKGNVAALTAQAVQTTNEAPIVITRESQREAAVGHRVTIRGVLTRTKIPTVCGVDVDDAYDLSDRSVVVQGVLQRTVVPPRDPSAPQIASRGPGTFYSVVDPATGRIAKPVAR